MNLSTRISAIDRHQRGRTFKIVATVVVLLGLLTYAGFSIVSSTTADSVDWIPEIPELLEDQNGNLIPNPLAQRNEQLRSILDVSQSPVNGVISVSLISAFLIVIIWLGLGLTYVGTITLVAIIGWPLYSLGGPGWSGVSSASALSRARSRHSVGRALTAPSTASIRDAAASIRSRGESSRAFSRRTASRAVIAISSSLTGKRSIRE